MSDWYQIESNSLIVQVTSKGAEMKRLFSKEWHRELLWLGNEKVWNRSAPVLFPIVGRLKDDEYNLKGKNYKMSQHGFARDFEFKCTECGTSEVEFLLEATQESFNFWPFCFELRVRYKIQDSKVVVSYFVKNVDRQDIYFSIGAHPGFETKDIANYEVRFEIPEKEYFQLNNGLVDWNTPHEFKEQKLSVTKNLFKDDALIFKKLKSKYIDLVDTKRREVIRVHANTPYWGIWAKADVPFVCIEPWYGVGDGMEHDKNFENKNGIVTLGEGEIFGFSYTLEMRLLPTEMEEKKK
ncbi:aldose 1-epimerase family protein [Bacteriovorax sp. PP10]|uniref:Aldose 1-epimerase family protein n=1 Tax=Bacteriovorax antarcticus TaxID=3088717 RepID=A0ABU5VX54_9BACT|nr:aldose 1-epimerase family protein [Bacteriovorax sp. PP10]MEA9356600.1 aldose 1-epimerase family protein [Bacteriovorax sp. PP10]